MRILHGPVNIGNQPWALSRAERRLGAKSDVVCNYATWPKFKADRVLSQYREKSPSAVWGRLRFGLTAPFRYDILHYYFGRSMLVWDDYAPKYQEGHWLYFRDLKLGRALGRTVVFTLQGCDVRLASRSNAMNRITMCRRNGCSVFQTCVSQLDAVRQRFMDTYLPLAHRVFYLNPELGHFLSKGEFMPYGNVILDEIEPVWPDRSARPRILHAPSSDSIKGSAQIEAALQELASRFDFEYVPIRSVSHEDAMKLCRSADLVIDQLLAGWYGGIAVETMAMGKPVACYIRDEDLDVLPQEMRADLPVLRINEATLVDDLAAILERQREWPEIGTRSRRFVERWHNPDRIARSLMR